MAAPDRKLVAVCMSGSARVIVHPVVLHVHRHHLLAPLNADLFAVVNLETSIQASVVNQYPVSELTMRGSERWRVVAALKLLGALAIVIQGGEDERPRITPCEGMHGQTAMNMFWTIQRCGEVPPHPRHDPCAMIPVRLPSLCVRSCASRRPMQLFTSCPVQLFTSCPVQLFTSVCPHLRPSYHHRQSCGWQSLKRTPTPLRPMMTPQAITRTSTPQLTPNEPQPNRRR